MAKNIKIAAIADVIKYKNPALVNYFAVEHGLSKAESEELFKDLKIWLWLSANPDSEFQAQIYNEHRVIDLYWHTFLMFTQDYIDFCQKYFGRIVMHEPAPHIAARRQAKNPSSQVDKNIKLLRKSIEEVVRLVDLKTVERWYGYLPEKYGKRFAKQFS